MFSACGEGWSCNERSLVFSAIRIEVLAFTSWPVTDDIGNELFNNMLGTVGGSIGVMW